MKKCLPIAIASMLLMTSCATVFTGSKQTVQINTYPEGAKVEVNGIERGVTPIALQLKKGFNGQTVTLKKEGYSIKIFQPETVFNGVSIINLTNVIGWGIDAATGAMMKYDPKVYELTLDKKEEAAK